MSTHMICLFGIGGVFARCSHLCALCGAVFCVSAIFIASCVGVCWRVLCCVPFCFPVCLRVVLDLTTHQHRCCAQGWPCAWQCCTGVCLASQALGHDARARLPCDGSKESTAHHRGPCVRVLGLVFSTITLLLMQCGADEHQSWCAPLMAACPFD